MTVFNGMFKLYTVTFSGLLTTKTVGFSDSTRKEYSSVVFNFLVPSLLFYRSATLVEKLPSTSGYWYLPFLLPIMINLIAFILLFILSLFFKLDLKTRRIFLFSFTFGNTTYLPLALIESITTETDMFVEDATDRGTFYLATFILINAFIYWLVGYPFLRRSFVEEQQQQLNLTQNNDNEIVENQIELEIENQNEFDDENNNNNNTVENEEENKNIENIKNQMNNEEEENEIKNEENNKENEKELINENNQNNQHNIGEENNVQIDQNSLKFKIIRILKLIFSKLPGPVQRFLFSPLFPVLCRVSVFIIILPIRHIFFNDGVLSIVGRSMNFLGSAAITTTFLLLGADFSRLPKQLNIKWYILILAIIVRLIIVPIICVGILYVLWIFNVIPKDPLYFFVISIECLTPPALSTPFAVEGLYPNESENVYTYLFSSYLFSSVSIPTFLIIILQIISLKTSMTEGSMN